MYRVLTIVGARPQFIKAAVVSRAINEREGIEELVLHTGQHYDQNMSDIFFDQLNIPRPNIQLSVNGGSHGAMTGRMLAEIEHAILEHRPDRLLVYGDTNSTLAGALAASKLHIPVAHVEAGLRSFNMKMPEEINRILTDQVSDILFCPTNTALKNLEGEGFKNRPVRMLNVGDVMQDSALLFSKSARRPDENLPSDFVLATLHRAENTDDPERLGAIVAALNRINESIAPVVMPLHPRTSAHIKALGLELRATVLDPVGYLEMLWLLNHCILVVTDSGGLQKEAFFFGKACVTTRDETEWVELVEEGANELVGAREELIFDAAARNLHREINDENDLYGGGRASSKVVSELVGE